ncbi:DUF418 domain-containing protein [Sutcliffiella halmapala]|uniref:DUF418 domain-containing protein n=1 Tax=Sutcliffiella halmapala TaxID=79882 RepID=UPI00099505D8|nr:DUF418 domain-containing protein [Sutcliffiella halmapala]
MNNGTETSPISTKDRIVSLDIIRGFALFGILLVNIPLFQSPGLIHDLYLISPELSKTDQFLRMLLDVFVETKFFTIFSLLFGVGFYIFMNRAEEKTGRFYRLFSRRLLVLALFGFLHLVLFWYGDILLRYALAGFLLIFFYKRKEKTILIWLLSFTIVMIILLSLSFFSSADSVDQQITSLQTEGVMKVEEAIEVYQNGSYVEWLSFRFSSEVIPVLLNVPFNIITSLYMFLIGLYVAKRGVFHNFPVHKNFVKRVWFYSFFISIPISTGIILLHLRILDFGVLNSQMIESLLMISGLSLSFVYVSTILLLLQKAIWKRLLHPLRYIGRMALTNYIFQTLIGVGLFVGIGPYGEINLRIGIMISLIVFPLQILGSYLWLKYFRYGPLEWVWRTLTYRSLRKSAAKMNTGKDSSTIL